MAKSAKNTEIDKSKMDITWDWIQNNMIFLD